MPATITLELKNLRFFANHGWHEEEATLGNEFDVTVLAIFPAQDYIDSIDDTIDYTKVYDVVKTAFQPREKLLETVAQKISNEIESTFPDITGIRITITKLNPVLSHFIGTLGVTYAADFR